MANPLHQDGLGQKGLGAHAFAESHGLSERHVVNLCRSGKIFGARKHPLQKNGGFTHQLSCYAPQEQSAKIHRPRCF
jgi:hypothetical protein